MIDGYKLVGKNINSKIVTWSLEIVDISFLIFFLKVLGDLLSKLERDLTLSLGTVLVEFLRPKLLSFPLPSRIESLCF